MQLAGVDVEQSRAEFDKYAASLLLVHGLWTSANVWRRPASFLAHLGWNSYALRWRGAAQSWRELRELCERAAAEVGEAVVIGHDLGALLALQMRGVRATVAISPLPCGPSATTHPFATSLRGRWARWRGGDILPAAAEAGRVMGLESQELIAEPSRWLDEIAAIDLRPTATSPPPRLLLAGGADPCIGREGVEAMAAIASAEVKIDAEGGHDLPYGPRWQRTATDAHRWIVQQLGESVLLLRGDEDLRDE